MQESGLAKQTFASSRLRSEVRFNKLWSGREQSAKLYPAEATSQRACHSELSDERRPAVGEQSHLRPKGRLFRPRWRPHPEAVALTDSLELHLVHLWVLRGVPAPAKCVAVVLSEVGAEAPAKEEKPKHWSHSPWPQSTIWKDWKWQDHGEQEGSREDEDVD